MENEITGFHAAQRFIEPQNHQRFVSTPEEYHNKRKAAQLNEAVDIIRNYVDCYGKKPPKEKLYEHFWLFEKDDSHLPEHFVFQNNLMPGSEAMTWNNFKNHDTVFANYDELVEYALKNKKQGMVEVE